MSQFCKENRPVFTNAPGGCGKSWLIENLKDFIQNCIPEHQEPVYQQNHLCNGINLEYTKTSSLFGRAATFAPSRLAAANCDGFTFHNGLSTHNISQKELNADIPNETIDKLKRDFRNV